jgi:hypothetical protein
MMPQVRGKSRGIARWVARPLGGAAVEPPVGVEHAGQPARNFSGLRMQASQLGAAPVSRRKRSV